MKRVRKNLQLLLGYGGEDQEEELPQERPAPTVETNTWMVQPHGGESVIIHRLPVRELTRKEAISLAAWLVHYSEDRYFPPVGLKKESTLSYFLTTLRNIRRQNAKP